MDAAIDFIERQVKAGKPFFVWWNGTHMHFRTHVADKDRGISGQDEYSDAMVLHDRHVGKLLQKLDDLGIADNTVVFYSTDNGPHQNTWPDAGTDAVPQREEHELGRRLPRTGDGALARPDQGWLGVERHYASHWTGCPRSSRWRVIPT